MEQLVERAARELAASRYAIALTGAGISTESGIRDFRGPDGVWTKNPGAERRAYRSYEVFLDDPKAWWKERLAATSTLGDLRAAVPNSGHRALVDLERAGILKCLITQNVDALHEKAGTGHLLEYHGSSAKLRCVSCNARFRRDEFDLETLIQEDRLPPLCPACGGVIKSDGVAFGEPIPSDVALGSVEEAGKCDVMLICGTSAVVYPFANLPRIARRRAAQGARLGGSGPRAAEMIPIVTIIEVNAEPTPLTLEGVSDYLIQGKTGDILPKMVDMAIGMRQGLSE
jgi:NAD-dependent deacetylase